MPRVVITRKLPEAGLQPLREAGFDMRLLAKDQAPSREELLAGVTGAAALITLVSDRVDDELLDAAGPGLRCVANYAVGVDNIDLEACAARGISVSNTPDVLTDATADLTMALLLTAARRLREADLLVRSGTWSGWQPGQLLGLSVAGATLGLVGMGRIGAAVARRARGFGMNLLYHNRSAKPALEDELDARFVALDELLANSDFVSLHCPLTPETRHLVDARALRLMRPHALLVNTARGPLVDESALAAALSEGRIWGAALDVFEHEPLVDERLVGLDNVVLAPHIGSATQTARTAMATLCARAVVDLLNGREPVNLVRARGEKNLASSRQ